MVSGEASLDLHELAHRRLPGRMFRTQTLPTPDALLRVDEPRGCKP
jgi:hypothetical protein